jgi:hypothetical protein
MAGTMKSVFFWVVIQRVPDVSKEHIVSIFRIEV